MDAQQFQIMSVIGFVCTAVFFIVAVIMFFAFDIPAIIGELSGKTAAKRVAQIREQNKRPVNRQRTINGYENMLANGGKTTETLKKEKKPIIPEWTSSETTILDEGTVLLSDETTLLNEEYEEGTTLLDEGTTLLSETEAYNDSFIIVQNIVVIHTNERI